MHEKSDAQLLRDYVQHGDEAAFAELVNRHTNLVYSAAVRLVDSPDLAAEVAQSAFIGLAHGARSLLPRLTEDASLAGWLCRSARNISLNLRRNEFRRHSRERQAMEHFHPTSETAPDWERLRPVLDDAMSELDETDYDALVMRFFKNQHLRSVGLALGVSDDTAQKRVTRALDKLREHLSRRGINTTATALSVVLTANTVQAAPVGLALTISTAAALAGTTIATSSTVIAATKATAMTLQKTFIAVALTAAVATGIYEAHQASILRNQNQLFKQHQAPLAEQIQKLSKDRDGATRQLAALRDENERLRGEHGELLRLRGEATRLRQEVASAKQAIKKNLAAQDSQSENEQTSTNTPPVETYSATIQAVVAWDQVLVTGGWKMPTGKRAIVFTSLKREADPTQLTIDTYIAELPQDVSEKLDLARFHTDSRDTQSASIMTTEQYKAILKSLQETTDVDILRGPRITTASGVQAEVQQADTKETSSGEKYIIGPTINITPTISADGQSVDLGVLANLNYPSKSQH